MNLRNHFGLLCYISQCEDGSCSARPPKTNKRYCCLLHPSLLRVAIQSPAYRQYHLSSQESTKFQSFEFRPLIILSQFPLPTESLRRKRKSRERGTKEWEISPLSRLFSLRKKYNNTKLIKIQLSLTFPFLPFQSFYSFKSLPISVKLKGSSHHL